MIRSEVMRVKEAAAPSNGPTRGHHRPGERATLVRSLVAICAALAALTAFAGCRPAPAPRGALVRTAPALENIRTLDLPDGDWTSPVWNPDGDAIVANKAEGGGDSQLWLIPLSGAAPTQLTTGAGNHITAYGRAWGPKGLLYSSDKTGEQEIWILDGTTFKPRRLGWTGGDNLAASWSPDGRAFVFMRRDYGQSFWQLWIGTVAGKLARLEPSHETSADAAQPAWGPDGKRLMFQLGQDGAWDIWFADIDELLPTITSRDPYEPTRLMVTITPFIASPAEESDATWLGDEGDAMFTLHATGTVGPNLYAVTDGVVHRLSDGRQPVFMAAASPDGSRLAYAQGRSGKRIIRVADLVRRPEAR